jgi:hypothetical protein
MTRNIYPPLVVILTMLGGCSTAHSIKGSSGESVVMIECGAATSFSICYDRAAKECPNGYRTVDEEPGFNRKTLKVSCN